MHHHALLKNIFEVKTFVGNLTISSGLVAQKTKFKSLKRIFQSVVAPVSGGEEHLVFWCVSTWTTQKRR